MSLVLIAPLIVINVVLAVGSIYRALRPDPTMSVGRQYASAVFGLAIAPCVILLLVFLAREPV